MTLDQLHSNKYLESILAGIGVAVIVIDTVGRITLFNSEAVAILGPLTETKTFKCPETYGVFKSELEEPLTDAENPIVAGMEGRSASKQEVFVRNDSLPLGGWCSINVRPLLDERNERIGGIIVIENITQQKRLSLELQRSNRDLQEFAYVAAHDLQEPLRTITGFGDLLEAGTRDVLNEKAADQLKRMLAAARRMQVLIGAVLKFARVETKAKPPELCEAKEIIDDAVSDLHSMIEQTGALVKINVSEKLLVDRTQATQLFQNIIANAIKYRSDKPPIIEITEKRLGIFAQFEIRDNGIGFDMRYANKVFVLFKQLHTRNKYEGAGVGLAVCKKIVERHGGNIRAESADNAGTSIYFTLPRVAPEEGRNV